MKTETLWTQRAVKEYRGGCSDMTIFRDVQRGILPKPIKIQGRNYWRGADVVRAYAGKPEPEAA